MSKALTLAAAALVVAGTAQAQVMTDVDSVTVRTTETSLQSDPYSASGVMPVTTTTTYTTTETTQVGSQPTVDPVHTAKVKLEDGRTVDFPDTADKSWQEYAREQGYDRFTFDPTSGLFIVGKGEAQFDKKWDENGNRIATPVAKPVKKKAAPKVVAEPVAEEPAVETPAAEPTADVPVEPETPAAEPTAEKPVTPKPSDAAPAEVMPSAETPASTPAATDAHGSGH